MAKLINKLARAREGATAIEYGLIAAFIALAMVVALPTIKSGLATKFGEVSTELNKDTAAAEPTS